MLTCELHDCEKETDDLHDVVIRGIAKRVCWKCYCVVICYQEEDREDN